ncbi:MAG: radical SAM protein [Candidatus Nitrosocaldaceae archaeon]
MVEIFGRGLREVINDTPLYLSLVKRYCGIRLFKKRYPLLASVDVSNICNLHCLHCYWWLNRKEETSLCVEEWRRIIRSMLKGKVIHVGIVGGEPLLHMDLVKVFCEEMPRHVSVVTNGTLPLQRLEGLYFYFVSIDGNRDVHDQIRGKGSYDRTKKNIFDYIEHYSDNRYKAWKDIWLSLTINSLNYMSIEDCVDEWHGRVNKIAVQFHTPFIKRDPLLLPFGKKRDDVILKLLKLKKKYPKFIANQSKQLELLRKSWGGKGTTPISCPSWAILSLDHMGRVKRPCCIGSADTDGIKPICEECGLSSYAMLYCYGIRNA